MRRIKVGVDISGLNNGHRTRGVGSYLGNLLKELQNNHRVDLIKFDNDLDFDKVDVVHYPFFDLYKCTLPIIKPKPVVVTIHDVIPALFPQHYPAGLRGQINFFLQKQSLSGTKAIITDSRSSAQDITRVLGVEINKIYPIYLAMGDEFKIIDRNNKIFEQTRNKYNLPKEFLIYVGSNNWNKNIVRIAEAAILSNKRIVFVGKSFDSVNVSNHPELTLYKEFLERFSKHPLVSLIGYVPTDDLVVMLNLAKICILTSVYEGFGLPILESQACGTPVITSDVSSMPEVAGTGAILVNPYHVNEIKVAIDELFEDSSMRRKLIDLGLQNIRHFSWKNTVEQTVDVYEMVARKS